MLQCPICHQDIAEPESGQMSKYYPFCSERCKLVDLGAWLDSDYVIQSRVESDRPDFGDQEF